MKRLARSQKTSLALARKTAKAGFKNIDAGRNSGWEGQASEKIRANESASGPRKRTDSGAGIFGAIELVKKAQERIISHLDLSEARKKRIRFLEERKTGYIFLFRQCLVNKPIPRQKAVLILNELRRYSVSMESRIVNANSKEMQAETNRLIEKVKRSNSESFSIEPKLIELVIQFNSLEVNDLLGNRAGFYWRELKRAIGPLLKK